LGLRGGPRDPNVDPYADPTAPPLEIGPPGPTIAAKEFPPKRRKPPEEDKPFDPVGLRLGDIDVKPYLEQDIAYATNPLGANSGAKGSFLSTTEAGVGWTSTANSRAATTITFPPPRRAALTLLEPWTKKSWRPATSLSTGRGASPSRRNPCRT
jgi:hypothetical protein